MKIETPLMVNLSHELDSTSTAAVFIKDVVEGLSKTTKSLPSRYFYDGKGSRIFQQIMNLPEYYLTRSEFEVLDMHQIEIAKAFSEAGFFHLIDLGAGDALKTKILLKQLAQCHASFNYVPVDISKDAMLQLTDSLDKALPDIDVQAVVGEYFEALQWLHKNKPERKVVLFLGSNIGNFELSEAKEFLKSIRHFLEQGDLLLMGVDLRKDPSILIPAYDDAKGVTASFNLNLLERINRELGADFDISKFKHYANYEPQEGTMKSFLISTVKQQITLNATNQTFHFDAWEAIHTENSYKYSIQQVSELAKECGFDQIGTFQDSKKFFADVLFTVA
jgi:L-histidine Nalpha-methyltransferase